MTGLNHAPHIEWIHPDPARRFTANPIRGCSNGCPYCYGAAITTRFGGDDFRKPVFYEDRLDAMTRTLARRRENCGVFLLSVSDPGSEGVRASWIEDLLAAVHDLRQHTFYLLTKQPVWLGRALGLIYGEQLAPRIDNLIVGVSIESRDQAHRVGELIRLWPGRKMVSYEPILGPPPEIPVEIDWVVLGGLSPQTRWLPEGWSSMLSLHEASAAWAWDMIRQTQEKRIPVFVKTHPADLPGVPAIQDWPEGWVEHPDQSPRRPRPESRAEIQAGLF